MNCKPGQRAIVIKGWPEQNIGQVIRVTELQRTDAITGITTNVWQAWAYEGHLENLCGRRLDWACDSCLQPLPDEDNDEFEKLWDTSPIDETVNN